MIEPLLLATTQISTFDGARILTAATGFFFERNARLHLVTSRHVVFDAPSDHHPSRIEFTVHTDAFNMSAVAQAASHGLIRSAHDGASRAAGVALAAATG